MGNGGGFSMKPRGVESSMSGKYAGVETIYSIFMSVIDDYVGNEVNSCDKLYQSIVAKREFVEEQVLATISNFDLKDDADVLVNRLYDSLVGPLCGRGSDRVTTECMQELRHILIDGEEKFSELFSGLSTNAVWGGSENTYENTYDDTYDDTYGDTYEANTTPW